MSADATSLKTTRAARAVVSIADIEALEAMPYDDLIPARTLLDLLRATAQLHPGRPALTTIPAGGFTGSSATVSHRDLYRKAVRAASDSRGRASPLPIVDPTMRGNGTVSARRQSRRPLRKRSARFAAT